MVILKVTLFFIFLKGNLEKISKILFFWVGFSSLSGCWSQNQHLIFLENWGLLISEFNFVCPRMVFLHRFVKMLSVELFVGATGYFYLNTHKFSHGLLLMSRFRFGKIVTSLFTPNLGSKICHGYFIVTGYFFEKWNVLLANGHGIKN